MDIKWAHNSQSAVTSLNDSSLTQNKHKQQSRRRDNARDTRKAQPLRSNAIANFSDKRPKPRGSGSVGPMDEWYSEVIPKETCDGKKLYGSKKHNLNHLLNFSFTSRDCDNKRNNGITVKGKHSKYSKEQFIHSNCQFIVRKGNDYSIHAVDPDISVDWNSIEEIRFNSLTSETVCPICLHTPVAAKITKCGHIYCWACILHYLSLSDQKWRKCPICFDVMRGDDLKSVSSMAKVDYKVGDDIVMCLMQRKKGCVITSPAFIDYHDDNCFKSMAEDSIVTRYQKILIASPQQILQNIIDRERTQLECQIEDDRDTPEVCFLQSALEMLRMREYNLIKECGESANDGACNVNAEPNANQVFEYSPLNPKCSSEYGARPSATDEFYHFYQSDDGQHIYLHALNVRMLRREYGSIDKCPNKIAAKIVEMEWDSMNDQMRKRFRYMQHLPLTCEFRIIELQFEPPIVSPHTLMEFDNEVNGRERMRNKRDHEERRRERYIQVEENKKIYGIYPLPKYKLNNQQFPSYDDAKDVRSSPSPTLSEVSSVNDDTLGKDNDNSLCSGMTPPIAENEFLSFAKMLREGKSKPHIGESPVNSNEVTCPVSEGDDYHAPQYHYSLSDAFEAAMELRSSKNVSDDLPKVGKKKKQKHTLLFGTGMKRGN